MPLHHKRWRQQTKNTGSAAQPTSRAERLCAKNAQTKNTGSAAKPTSRAERLRAKNDAFSSYESYQARLQNMFEELQLIWFEVFDADDTPATQRISWRSCWGKLESMLKAIFLDVLAGTMMALSSEPREKFANVVGAFKAKLTYHHHQTVLQNQSRQLLECFTELNQRASDVSTWHTILDDLLCDKYANSQYRITQSSLIELHLDQAQQGLRQIAAHAQHIAVPYQEPVRP